MTNNNNYNAKYDKSKLFSASGSYVPGHSPWLNGQCDITGLTEAGKASGLIRHILQNETRSSSKETLNPHPKFNSVIAKTELDEVLADVREIAKLQAKQRRFCSKHHRKLSSDERFIDTSKSAKAGRFGVVQGNLNPNNPNNVKALDAWFKGVKMAVLSVYPEATGFSLHLNEVCPGVHFFLPSYRKIQGPKGVSYEFDKTHKRTGKEGKRLLFQLHEKLQAVSKSIAKSFGLDFRQEPVTEKGQNRKVAQFRRIDQKLETSEPLSRKEARALNNYVQNLVKNAVSKERASHALKQPRVIERVVEKVVEKQVPVRGGKFDAAKVDLWDRLFDVLEKSAKVPDHIKEFFDKKEKLVYAGGDEELLK